MRIRFRPGLVALVALAAGDFVCGAPALAQDAVRSTLFELEPFQSRQANWAMPVGVDGVRGLGRKEEGVRVREGAHVQKVKADADRAKKAAAAALGTTPDHVRVIVARWRLDKYWGDHVPGDGKVPYESRDLGENLLTTAGCTRLLNLLIGTGSTQAYDSTHTRIGVSDTTGTAAVGNTDLFDATGGSTHRQWKLIDTTTTVSTNVATFHATFATGEANFHWQDFGIDAGTADGTSLGSTAPLLNHKASDLGTKTSAASWSFSVTLTISACPLFGLADIKRWLRRYAMRA